MINNIKNFFENLSLTAFVSLIGVGLTFCEFIKSKSIKNAIIILIVTILICLSILFYDYNNKRNDTTDNESNNQEIKITQETTTEAFIPDYEPGEEKIIKNDTYKNNLGRFSRQGKKYYFSTAKGIYKSDENFSNSVLITDVKYAQNLNVLGDWIFYSTSDGIYKIRTDGQLKEQIVKTNANLLDMTIMDNIIYYIKMGGDLYSICTNGKSEKCILDKKVYRILGSGAYLYFVEAKVSEDNTYQPISLNRMTTSGKIEIEKIFENKYKKNGAMQNDTPMDLCETADKIIFCNDFGLFSIDKYSDEIKQLNKSGGMNLCVIDNYAYYEKLVSFENGNIVKANINSGKTKLMDKPFDDKESHVYLYPTGDKIILTTNFENWYYINESNELKRIVFE